MTRSSELFVIFVVSPCVAIASIVVFYRLMNHIFLKSDCGWQIQLLAAVVLVVGMPFLGLFLFGLLALMLSY